MDGLMGRYHIRTKTRDAATRLFYHFIDMAATNAYILYRRIHRERMNESSDMSAEDVKLLQLPQFRQQIASGLVNYTSKRGIGRPTTSRPTTPDSRPSTPIAEEVPGLLGVGKRTVYPVADVRYDGVNHLPKFIKNRVKCKHCKAQTHCVCTKCNLSLCCSQIRNCFEEYHTKK